MDKDEVLKALENLCTPKVAVYAPRRVKVIDKATTWSDEERAAIRGLADASIGRLGLGVLLTGKQIDGLQPTGVKRSVAKSPKKSRRIRRKRKPPTPKVRSELEQRVRDILTEKAKERERLRREVRKMLNGNG